MRGKNRKKVFLDVFSPPENESGVHFPVTNLVPTLENWWTFAVRHCTVDGAAEEDARANAAEGGASAADPHTMRNRLGKNRAGCREAQPT